MAYVMNIRIIGLVFLTVIVDKATAQCVPNPCNQGTCVVAGTVQGYVCACFPGFQPPNCQTLMVGFGSIDPQTAPLPEGTAVNLRCYVQTASLAGTAIIWRRGSDDITDSSGTKIIGGFLSTGRYAVTTDFTTLVGDIGGVLQTVNYTLSTLKISGLALADHGTYTSTSNAFTKNQEVRVIAPVEKVILTTSATGEINVDPLRYVQGNSGTLSCFSEGGEPRPSLKLFIGTTDYTSRMTVTNSQRSVKVGGIPSVENIVRLTRTNIPANELGGYNNTKVRCEAYTVANVISNSKNASIFVRLRNQCDGTNPCLNGGTCIPIGTTDFRCLCPGRFTGKTCTTPVPDPCGAHFCLNGGTCTNTPTGFNCACPQRYTGRTCETGVNFCDSNPCRSRGQCRDSPGAFTCICDQGYGGRTCEHNMNECSSNPCQNSAKCIDGPNSYVCNCTAGYNGTHCEVPVAQVKEYDIEQALKTLLFATLGGAITNGLLTIFSGISFKDLMKLTKLTKYLPANLFGKKIDTISGTSPRFALKRRASWGYRGQKLLHNYYVDRLSDKDPVFFSKSTQEMPDRQPPGPSSPAQMEAGKKAGASQPKAPLTQGLHPSSAESELAKQLRANV